MLYIAVQIQRFYTDPLCTEKEDDDHSYVWMAGTKVE